VRQVATAGIDTYPVGYIIRQLHIHFLVTQIDTLDTLVREDKLITEVRTLVMEPQKPGELSGPVGREESYVVIRVHQVQRGRTQIEQAEDAGLEDKFPLPAERRAVAVEREGFTEGAGKGRCEIIGAISTIGG
jgi:hypothetical protein